MINLKSKTYSNDFLKSSLYILLSINVLMIFLLFTFNYKCLPEYVWGAGSICSTFSDFGEQVEKKLLGASEINFRELGRNLGISFRE